MTRVDNIIPWRNSKTEEWCVYNMPYVKICEQRDPCLYFSHSWSVTLEFCTDDLMIKHEFNANLERKGYICLSLGSVDHFLWLIVAILKGKSQQHIFIFEIKLYHFKFLHVSIMDILLLSMWQKAHMSMCLIIYNYVIYFIISTSQDAQYLAL